MRFFMMGCINCLGKKNLKWLGVVATLMMTFLEQLGGALVTKTGSADGCGSWLTMSWCVDSRILSY